LLVCEISFYVCSLHSSSVGSLPEFLRPTEAGDADIAWTKEFGDTMAFKGVMGVCLPSIPLYYKSFLSKAFASDVTARHTLDGRSQGD
jgi:hypothetical protein